MICRRNKILTIKFSTIFNTKKCLFFFVSVLLVGVGYGQRYKDFKAQLKTEAAKYRTTEACEAETKKAIENLDNLIWSDTPPADKKEEIRRSSAFVRTKGCPQGSLLALLKEISDFYKEGGGQTSTTTTPAEEEEAHITNLSDTLTSPEEENANPTGYKPPVYTKPSRDYFLYFLTGILSLICIWLLLKTRNNQPIVPAKTMTNEKLDQIGDNQLADIIRQLRDDLGLLRHRLAELDSEVQSLKAQLRTNPPTFDRQKDDAQIEQPLTQNEGFVVKRETTVERDSPQQDAAPEMRFALYMDNSDGFSVSGLMYHEGAETIYEIALQSPKTAVYRIAQNRDAQTYALSDPGYYLRTACDYENPPASGKRIETVSEGTLELVGSIWKITKRAKVRFV